MIAHVCLLVLLASDVDLMRIHKDLARALKEQDVEELAAGFVRCSKENTLDSLKVLLRYYGPVEDIPDGDITIEDRFRLYTVAARSIARMTDREAIVAIPGLAAKEKHWGARAILLAGARLNTKVDAVALCENVLKKEKYPLVLQEAIKTLGESRRREAIRPLIDYWETLAKKMGPSRATVRPPRSKRKRNARLSYRSPEWERVPLALQEALTRLTGKMLSNAEQYRRLYEYHGKEIDPTKVKLDKLQEGRTKIFGLDLVGKNIAFVLDVSGSMETTDPPPAGYRPGGPRTKVRKKGGAELLIDTERMRILRAKKELKKVVASLPEDKSFNVIAFSSDVKPWQDTLVPAKKRNKDKAADFIDALRPEGITVTDVALEFAFEDPIVDTIYLITDGAPTHRGSYGPGLPEDAPQLIKEILKRTKVLNHRRSVRIFTLGFPGAEEKFLEQLAEDHGGTYRPIK